MDRSITAIVDLQFGSTGKGLMAGYWATKNHPDTLVTAWAANAGHTFIDGDGRKFVHTMLANGIVSPNLKRILIGPGSIINPGALIRELEDCRDLLEGVPVYVHEHAAVITERHVYEESSSMTKIGSTKKGVGAAAIQRIRRNPDDMNVAKHVLKDHPIAKYVTMIGPQGYAYQLDQGRNILVEGAQGHSLSMYHGFYPYTTSRDVSVAQMLADCAIPVCKKYPVSVIGTARTFPIRVANRYNDEGVMIGTSGPHYLDQKEISFAEIGQEVELTTVTKLPRRIFTFSMTQVMHAVRQNGVEEVFLNFCNYFPVGSPYLDRLINMINSYTSAKVRWLGFGPTVDDVADLNEIE